MLRRLAFAGALALACVFPSRAQVGPGPVPQSTLAIGTSPVAGGVSGDVLFNNAGTLGERAVSGTGAIIATTTGVLVNGNCVEIDASGNLVDAGAACGSGSGGLTVGTTTVTSGTNGHILFDNSGVLGELAPSGNGTTIATTTGTLVSGDCVQIDASGNFIDTGSPCGSGGGGITALTGDVTASGSGSVAATVARINGATLGTTTATSGHILIGQGSSWVTEAVSGDATLASTGVWTLATVNSNTGTFGSSSTIPSFTVNGKGLITAASSITLSASNITTGTLPAAQLPNPTLSALGGIEAIAAVSHQWINAISTAGVPSLTQPAFTDISGSVAATQMPALTGDVTSTAGTVATTITAGVVTGSKIASATITGSNIASNTVANANLANMVGGTHKCNPVGFATGSPIDCSFPTINVLDYGASGSIQSTTGTISATSHSLAIASAIDFANGQGIRVNHAGAASTTSPPTAASATPQGTPGATTYSYTIASVDNHGGVGAAITTFTTTTGNATLSSTNFNKLSWTAPGSAPAGYVIYGRIGGSLAPLVLIPASRTTWNDYGQATSVDSDWIPSTPPASALADWLVTTISSGGGTTTLTLTAAATTAASSQTAMHDDTSNFQAAINALPAAGGEVIAPCVEYPISTTVSMGNGTVSSLSTTQGMVLRGVCNPTSSTFPFAQGARLVWVGGPSQIVDIQGPLEGWGVKNLAFDCNFGAAHGLAVVSAKFGNSHDLEFNYCTDFALYSSTIAIFGGNNTDSLQNKYYNMAFTLPPLIDGAGMISFDQESGGTSDTDANFVAGVYGATNANFFQYGIYLNSGDVHQFHQILISGGTSGAKITFSYPASNSHTGGTSFYTVDVGCLSVTPCTEWANSGTPGSDANYIYGLSTGNGGSIPHIANLVAFSGTLSGNTSVFATVSGSLTSGDCLQADANGNVVTTGSACGSGGGGITALTGDVTASGSGSVIATVASGAISLSKMANETANTVICNPTGLSATPQYCGTPTVAGVKFVGVSTGMDFTVASPAVGSDAIFLPGGATIDFNATTGPTPSDSFIVFVNGIGIAIGDPTGFTYTPNSSDLVFHVTAAGVAQFLAPSGTPELDMIDGAGGNSAIIVFESGGTKYFNQGIDTSHNFNIFDVAGSATAFNLATNGAMTLSPVGNVNINPTGGTTAITGAETVSTTLLVSGAATFHSHIASTTAAAPTLTAGCNGTGSSVSGTDTSGFVTGKTATSTTCTLTFGTAYASAPQCVVSPLNIAAFATPFVTVSNSSIQTTFTSTANVKWSYHCFGS